MIFSHASRRRAFDAVGDDACAAGDLFDRLADRDPQTGYDVVSRRIHRVIVLFGDLPIVVAVIVLIFREPVGHGREDLHPPCRETFPHRVDARFDAVVGQGEMQAQPPVKLIHPLPVDLGSAIGGRIDDARNPVASRADRGGMCRWFDLSAIVLGVEIHRIAIEIVRAPYGCRSIPAHVEAIGFAPVLRDQEGGDGERFGFNWIDRADAERGNAFGTGLAQVRGIGGEQLGLHRLGDVRHVLPSRRHQVLGFADNGHSDGPMND